MKPGEEKTITVTFPEDYHAEHLKGKEANFKVKVNELKRKKLPELDDEFAKDVSEFDTLEEYKADLRKKLEERAAENEKAYKRDTVVEQAAANAKIDIPEVMIEHEIEHMLRDLEQRLQIQGMTLDMYYQFAGTDEEGMKAQFREDAEKRVRISLTLEAIAKQENIEPTDEEIDEELTKMAEMYQLEVDKMRERLTAIGQLDSLKNEVKIRKTIDFLVNNSVTVA